MMSHSPGRDIDIGKLKEFVLSRQNEDGGFTFCKPVQSTLPETFYAIHILKTIGEEIPRRDEIVGFLRNNIRDEPYAIFWVLRSLHTLNEKLPDVSDYLIPRLESTVRKYKGQTAISTESGTTATYTFSTPNILRWIYTLTVSLKLTGRDIPNSVKEFVRKFRKSGGFGVASPNLQDTYYAISVIEKVERSDEVVSYILKHETPGGGFAKVPKAQPPYLEDTFYALSCLKMLNRSYRERKTIEYIYSLQNRNGGFRRSIYGGISTLENTYYAVECLRHMNALD